MSKPTIEVVCGIIVRHDGDILIGQRPIGKHLAGQWEFPGGKIEKNENAETAIRRELLEELDCEVNLVYEFESFYHCYEEDIAISMISFVCELVNRHRNPKALQHTSLKWVPVEEITKYELVAADVMVLELFRKWKKKSKEDNCLHCNIFC
jgi:8-oxo-dGTP diphosphatase